jgi:hypothetical protein
MALQITATDVAKHGPGIYVLEMPPHQVRSFGSTAQSYGSRSILQLRDCEYDEDSKELTFELSGVMALNVGTTTEAIAVDSKVRSATHGTNDSIGPSQDRGPGDRQFLELARSELTDKMGIVAQSILDGVRNKFAGDLKKGKSRNFSETPDNFWYVIVQPRIDELSFTVRGPVDHFKGLTSLEVKDDRGNTRFKVRSENDVPAALKLISRAIRK